MPDGSINLSQPGSSHSSNMLGNFRFYSQLAQNGFQACRYLSPLESLRLGIVSFMLVFRAEDVCWWLELETSAPSSPKHGQEQRVIAGFVKVFGALKSRFPSMKQTHHQFKASPRWIQNQCWPPRSTPHLNAWDLRDLDEFNAVHVGAKACLTDRSEGTTNNLIAMRISSMMSWSWCLFVPEQSRFSGQWP